MRGLLSTRLFSFFSSIYLLCGCPFVLLHGATRPIKQCVVSLQEVKMIYSIRSAQFSAFLATGKRTPTTDEVCDALTAIKEAYPMLEPTDVSS